MRHVILHCHLFKNAGTSVDHILRDNFGTRWLSREFDAECGVNAQTVGDWIVQSANGVAYSTHTLIGPLPKLPGVEVIPVLLLRDPVERIASAYRFERGQDAQTQGAILAKQHGFAGYVHARLSLSGDRQCRNFQTERLAAMAPDIPGSELDRAYAALRALMQAGVLGLVSDFAGAMARLQDVARRYHPAFTWQPVKANASGKAAGQSMSPDMRQVLLETNKDDLELLRRARELLRHAPTVRPAFHPAGML